MLPAPTSVRASPLKQPRPCIHELLRTCVHPPSIQLSVERVIVPGAYWEDETVSRSDGHPTRPVARYVLSDTKYLIQAVLVPKMHGYEDIRSITAGDVLDVKEFQVRRSKRTHGKGNIVYLVIQDCHVLKVPRSNKGTASKLDTEGGFLRDEERASQTVEGITRYRNNHTKLEDVAAEIFETTSRKRIRDVSNSDMALIQSAKRTRLKSDNDGEEDEDFETMSVNTITASQRRKTLLDLRLNVSPLCAKSSSENVGRYSSSPVPRAVAETVMQVSSEYSTPDLSMSSAKSDSFDIQEANGKQPTGSSSNEPLLSNTHAPSLHPASASAPAPATEPASLSALPKQRFIPTIKPITPSLHTLHSLFTTGSLPRRSYPCSVFALISWVSPSLITRSNSPFPPKRHIKIHDPSITTRHSGVTVAVYLDAETFKPLVGTVALFRGVVMQKVGISGGGGSDGIGAASDSGGVASVGAGVDVGMANEIILNAYSTLGQSVKETGQDWFVTDADELTMLGLDVPGMKEWWAERVKERKTKRRVTFA